MCSNSLILISKAILGNILRNILRHLDSGILNSWKIDIVEVKAVFT